MSRIAKKPITVNDKIKVSLTPEKEGYLFKVVGPLGENSRFFKKDIKIEIDSEGVKLTPTKPELLEQKALWGTYAAHIKNMIEGVTVGFKKSLQIEGIGYKTQIAGNRMTWSLGFSHTIDVEVPKGLKATVEKNNVSITGVDKEAVGQFAAQIVAMKPPEPYKGKGIRYEGQHVRIKEGKKSVA
ncbi:MAG: 50S ribosomal protein L6 [Candidatus Vogelbacteria bacterium]|nr:50S ribosomal protein L6 [Candidatus Vogelbacteria bacterium]